jgi:hypothetical protein
MLMRTTGIVLLALALAVATTSPAAAKSFKAKPANGRAHVEVKLEIEKKGTVRELAVKDAEHIPLADGNYALSAVINTATGPVAVSLGTVTVRKGKFKKVELRQVGSGILFTISEANPPLTVVVTVGTVILPPVGAAPFRRG